LYLIKLSKILTLTQHLYGIKIDNIDNPGWSVNIDLKDTSLENKSFSTIKYDIDENDWLFCTIRNGAFNGAGGSNKLEEILLIFKDWAES
jgi:hypothetical protein